MGRAHAGDSLVTRANRRHLQRHPLQLLLAVLGVALGVTVVVAVQLANESARRAFALSVEDVAGRATHQIVGGPNGVDERVYTRLRVEMGLRASAPVVEAYGRINGQETVHLLGVDPLAEAGVRRHVGAVEPEAVRHLLVEPDAALLAAPTARRLGLEPGDPVAVTLAGRSHRLTVAGLIGAGRGSAAAIDGLLLVDIATAQTLMGMEGRLSWIDVRLPEGSAGTSRAESLNADLPESVRLVPAEARKGAFNEMTRAFRTNLTAMGLLALVVGMFLIYNTMTFAVLQRRALIAVLRVLGVSRGQVFRAVMGEALVIGLLGTALGLLAGIALGQGLVQLVTRTINDLYFTLTVTRLLITPGPLVVGLALGTGATLTAALGPALEAAGAPPRLALQRSVLESRSRRLAPRLALVGLAMAVAAAIVMVLTHRDVVAGFVALFLLILGLTLVAPLAVAGAARVAGPVLPLIPRLAVRGVEGALSRTGVAVAALMLAVATTVGVGIMVDSFRQSVAQWLTATVQADIYVAAPSSMGARTRSRLPASFPAALRSIPGVAQVVAGRRVTVESQTGRVELRALELARGRPPRLRLTRGDPDRVWPAFRADAGVLVSEPYAFHRDIDPGDRVALPTARGDHGFPVLGVYQDYGSDRGVVLMPRSLYARWFADPAVSELGVYLEADAHPDAVLQAIRARAQQPVEVRSSAAIRAHSLAVFDRTFTITNVLRLLAILVAFVAILSALMAVQLERARELGVLRATGLTPGQVGGLVGLQTGFMGLAAGVLALPAGLVLALVLIHVINRRSFGWTMDTVVAPELLAQAVVLALAAAVLAGIYPAWRMARMSPADALREE